MRLLLALCLAAATLPVAEAGAQRNRVPDRPRLPAEADTNDYQAYFQYGMSVVVRQPARAANAFYWATRLAPTWGDAYYAHRMALLMSDRRRMVRYFFGEKSVVNSRQAREVDSLATEALYRNPFYFARLERTMIDQVVMELSGNSGFMSSRRTGDAAFDGYMAYTEARFEDAIELYGDALRRRSRDYQLRAPRARAFYHRMKLDSAANELTLLLAEMRRRDEDKLVYFYDSKAMLEYSLARVYLQLGDETRAREALGRALEEDLSFHMAHVDLADLALADGDTTTALSELALAVELRGNDVGVRSRYGDALVSAGRPDEAIAQYQAAIEAEPWFAHPYYRLAVALEGEGRTSEAAEQYREFIARAARNHSDLADAQARLARLGTVGPESQP